MPTVDVNGTTLAYDDEGPRDGATLLLAHSLFFHRGMFDELVAELGDDVRVVRYDHRGQGGSAPAPRAQLDMDTLAADAAALVETLGLGRVHVAGNSMGGFVALRLAARRPDLVRSAVAMSSSAEEEHQIAAFDPLVDVLARDGGAAVLDTLVHIMFGDSAGTEQPALVQQWRGYMAGLGPAIGDAAYQVVHRRGVVAELAGVTVPVLAVAGVEDHAYPPPISSTNIADATGGRSVVVAGAGHSVALERPKEVATLLREHLASLDG